MNILITGASRGIGYELVKLFCDVPGNDVFIVSRSEQALQELVNECRRIQPYTGVIAIKGDISDLVTAEQIAKTINEQSGSLDILINNAGYLVNKAFIDTQANELETTFKTNIIGPILLIQRCLPLLQKSKAAHIVNISSMGGFQGSVKFNGLAAYSSSKAALVSLTECLAEELKDTSVKVNCLALGAVQTEMLNKAFPGYQAPIKAYEMAEYIKDFAINGYRFFNGKIIPVSLSTP